LSKYSVGLASLVLLLCSAKLSVGQTADFTSNITDGCFPLVIQFSDISTGSPSSWQWSFGNGNTSTVQNPSAIYTTPGTYTVSLTVNGGSTETKMNYIVVHNNPTAEFSADNTFGCAPATINFINESTADAGHNLTYEWVFGDGSTSTEVNPQKTYADDGTYSVTLVATNQFGCINTMTKTNYVTVAAYYAEFTTDTETYCSTPAQVNFVNNSVGPGDITYLWDFGDGNTSTEMNPSHEFTNPGSYNVSLTLQSSSCGEERNFTKAVVIGTNVTPVFDIKPQDACKKDIIYFSTNVNADVKSVLWDFGDGNTSSILTPNYTYVENGNYTVTLTTEYFNGCTVNQTKKVSIIERPIANFNTAQQCGEVISFTNMSEHSNSWHWDFGDGSTSQGKNPTHTYSSYGSYKVILTAKNQNCEVQFIKFVTVKQGLEADFSPTENQSCESDNILGGCIPKTIDFIDESAFNEDIVSWSWDFGDGATSTSQSPAHTYTTAGDFLVKLTVKDAAGCESFVERTVSLTDQQPIADFKADILTACVYEAIVFTDDSEGEVDFWCWDFGDGVSVQTESLNIAHAYTSVGVFTVKLIASFKGCKSAEVVKEELITIVDPAPTFEIEKTCEEPYTVTFNNTTVNADSFLWDFGDGTTSDKLSPDVHTYPETGLYIVKLTATNNTTGCTVTNATPLYIYDVSADFEANNLKLCKNDAVTFTNNSIDGAYFNWNFGNGETSSEEFPDPVVYTTPGKYEVTLEVTDGDGCSAIKTKSDYITVADIEGDFLRTSRINYCDTLEVAFEDATVASVGIEKWFWEFGDGTTSDLRNPTKLYSEEGFYEVGLTVTNDEGACTVLKDNFVVFAKPHANIITEKGDYCVDEPITLTNASTNSIRFKWDLPDNTALGNTVSTSFDAKGIYNISLMATDFDNCTDTTDIQIEIHKPTAAFSAQQTSAECPPLITTFVNESSESSINWAWSLDAVKSSVEENPVYTYTVPGTYDVELVVTDKFGCQDTSFVSGFIELGGPNGSFEVNRIESCTDNTIEFTATATNTKKYIWDYGDGILHESSQPTASHIYTTSGSYFPSLILEDTQGCQFGVSQAVEIDIFDVDSLGISSNVKYPFTGEAIDFGHNPIEGGSWIWDMGDGTVIESSEATHSYEEPGVYQVQLQYVNALACDVFATKGIWVQTDDLEIPNVFTPSLVDDKNDIFQMPGLEYGEWNISILNRWGKEVYNMDNYDGQWTGESVAAGVYYYYLTNAHRPEKTFTGYVHVLK
jgi:gliding motility-associated-like protein